VAACVKIMWYNGDVERHIWSVSALNSVTPNGKLWNESFFASYKVQSRISQQDLKKHTKKTVGIDSGVPEKNICRILIINSQHAVMMKSQKLLDSCSVATKVFIS